MVGSRKIYRWTCWIPAQIFWANVMILIREVSFIWISLVTTIPNYG
jgi:hypothetical protein